MHTFMRKLEESYESYEKYNEKYIKLSLTEIWFEIYPL